MNNYGNTRTIIAIYMHTVQRIINTLHEIASYFIGFLLLHCGLSVSILGSYVVAMGIAT